VSDASAGGLSDLSDLSVVGVGSCVGVSAVASVIGDDISVGVTGSSTEVTEEMVLVCILVTDVVTTVVATYGVRVVVGGESSIVLNASVTQHCLTHLLCSKYRRFPLRPSS
jgi:uncharacterized membrane protein